MHALLYEISSVYFGNVSSFKVEKKILEVARRGPGKVIVGMGPGTTVTVLAQEEMRGDKPWVDSAQAR